MSESIENMMKRMFDFESGSYKPYDRESGEILHCKNQMIRKLERIKGLNNEIECFTLEKYPFQPLIRVLRRKINQNYNDVMNYFVLTQSIEKRIEEKKLFTNIMNLVKGGNNND